MVEEARTIEKAIHELGRDLLKLRIAVKGVSIKRSSKTRKKTRHIA